MKKLVLLFTLVFVLGIAGVANALPFLDLIDWPNFEVVDSFEYTHTLSSIPAGSTLDSATLSIKHNGNSYSPTGGSGELWLVKSGALLSIGTLSNSGGTVWTIDSFVLGQNILDEISGTSPWSLVVKLQEDTTGTDKLNLDWSKLEGTYTPGQSTNPIPEPGTMMLLGTGLLGMIGYGKVKFGKK